MRLFDAAREPEDFLVELDRREDREFCPSTTRTQSEWFSLDLTSSIFPLVQKHTSILHHEDRCFLCFDRLGCRLFPGEFDNDLL